jgi:hypothetical protein
MSLKRAWNEPVLLDRFGLVLALVLATIVSQALLDVADSSSWLIVTHALSGAALLVAVRAAGVSKRLRRAADGLVLVVVAANVITLFVVRFFAEEGRVGEGGPQPELLWLIAAALVPIVVARRLWSHEVVSVQTVLGAVAAYLQIAVAYALAFQAVDALGGEPFFGSAVPSTSYMYISLQTITTLGYGDLVAVSEFGRLLAVSEAVLGQVFLVTFVAMIVARFVTQSGSPSSNDGPDQGLDEDR